MRKAIGVILVILLVLSFSFASVGMAVAGQPNQSCEEQPLRPGNSISAPGSAFNPMALRELTMQANNLRTRITHSVSQYDVACYQVSSHH